MKTGNSRRMSSRLGVALLAATLATGCQALTGRTAGENIDDAGVTALVKSTLVADKVANLMRIDVDTNREVVSLNGVVQSNDERTRAEDLARRIDGVRAVNNNLQVQNP